MYVNEKAYVTTFLVVAVVIQATAAAALMLFPYPSSVSRSPINGREYKDDFSCYSHYCNFKRGSLRMTKNSSSSQEAADAEIQEPKMGSKQIASLSDAYIYNNNVDIAVDETSGQVLVEDKMDYKAKKNVDATTVSKDGSKKKKEKQEKPQQSSFDKKNAFNIVLTHCTADFDTLASAVGLAKLWSTPHTDKRAETCDGKEEEDNTDFDNNTPLPTYVVLPRGAHPSVQRFLALHEHLFPIRSLKSLTEKTSLQQLSNLNRLGLVDAQRKDRIGPADVLLEYAKHVVIVDHHIDNESDIIRMTEERNIRSDYVLDKVGAVSTMIAERLKTARIAISQAEATLLALGIHGDTGSLCYDSTTARDAMALAYCLENGASQAAIAENMQPSLSSEQQQVLTQVMLNTNSTKVDGVTVSTVLLSTDGFINGLAAVTQDALDLSSSDVYLLAVVYDPKSNPSKFKKSKSASDPNLGSKVKASLISSKLNSHEMKQGNGGGSINLNKDNIGRVRLRAAFNRKDIDGSGFLERNEIATALLSSGIVTSQDTIDVVFDAMDTDGNGKVDFDEFASFAEKAEAQQKKLNLENEKKSSTMIVIGRVKAGISVEAVNLNELFRQFGGGGHAKAASMTVRLSDESDASGILQNLVDELISTSLLKQPPVCDFMTAPVMSATPDMTEQQVDYMFKRYDIRALPVVDDDNNVIGLVTSKEVASAKQRLVNKQEKQAKQKAKREEEARKRGEKIPEMTDREKAIMKKRKLGSALKGWMLQHVTVCEGSKKLNDVESMLLENEIGCIPVVADGTMQLIGMVTRTDLLRQHRYYSSLHYNNKAFSDSIAARKPIIELRKRLKKFDIEE